MSKTTEHGGGEITVKEAAQAVRSMIEGAERDGRVNSVDVPLPYVKVLVNAGLKPAVSPGQTHSKECWTWGPRHYECALAEIERLSATLPTRGDQAEVARLRKALEQADADFMSVIEAIAFDEVKNIGTLTRGARERLRAALPPTSSAEPQDRSAGAGAPADATTLAAQGVPASSAAPHAEPQAAAPVGELELLKYRLETAKGFMDRVLDRKGIDGWTLQSSIYEGFSTEIWADEAEPGKRTIAIVRDYHDAQRIMAALAAAPVTGDRETAGVERYKVELQKLFDTLDAIVPALAVLKTMCFTAGLKPGADQAAKMQTWATAALGSASHVLATPPSGGGDHAAEPQAPDGGVDALVVQFEKWAANNLEQTRGKLHDDMPSRFFGRAQAFDDCAGHLRKALVQRPPGESKPEGEE